MLTIKILGSAAGGGYPQWNCRCDSCEQAWRYPALSQTQSSIAFSIDNVHWYLGNASPDIRQQILATPALHPNARRGSPIQGIFLTNADLDHVLGTLLLREDTPWSLFATTSVLSWLEENPFFSVLNTHYVNRIPLSFVHPIRLNDFLEVQAFPVAGKNPLYLEKRTLQHSEHTIGLQIKDCAEQKTLIYIPGCGMLTDTLLGIIEKADMLLFDGTLWHDEELISTVGRKKTAKNIAHIPISGPQGSLNQLQFFKKPKYYIHINNTNPIWQQNNPARYEVEAAGWKIAQDGMEITL